ncbi:hybrid sensor histidine kinase/response regulator [Dysgonomonas sp. 25]|nr:hybrid sensor histidine kinase/response regulator [Dysgonomonas sp. 25]
MAILKIVFVLLAAFASDAFARDYPNFNFKSYQVDDGLSENTVHSILQDRKGFMWFGTKDGLNKFDGFNFRVFRNSPQNPQSIGNNYIRVIIEGEENALFLGTDLGVYKMDTNEEIFEDITLVIDDEEVSPQVYSLLKDDDLLWIGTYSGSIITYDTKTGESRKIEVNQYDLEKNTIWCFYKDKAGAIWAGTRLGLLRYNRQTERFEAESSLFSLDNAPSNETLSIAEDKRGNLWLGTWARGIRLYSKYSGDYKNFFGPNSPGYYISHIRTLFFYNENTLLIGSDDGLYSFNIETEVLTRLDKSNSAHTLTDKNVYSMKQDKEGNMWIGTYFGGVNYLNMSTIPIESYYAETTQNTLSGRAISQMIEDDRNNIWIATEDGGLNYFDTRKRTFTQPIQTSYSNIHALLLDDDELWIGTFSRGIDIYNLKTKRLRNYRNTSHIATSLNDDCIFSIYKSFSGDIYAGTPFGLNKYNKETDNFTRIPQVSAFIYDMKEDIYGNFWFATYGDGVIRYNRERKEWIYYDEIFSPTNPIVNSKLTSIYIDSQKQLWFTSEGRGIFLYDYQNDIFRNFSEIDGKLPNNVVYGILDDLSGNIWLSCNKGILYYNRYKPEDNKLYTKQDGLQSNEFNYKSSLRTKDGKFYFGGINGITCFYPQDLSEKRNEAIPDVRITDFTLLDDEDKKLSKKIMFSINKEENITLPYNKSSFIISFASLSYVSPAKNLYAYKLEGVDNDWNYINNNNSVTYINLPPGVYKFRIKASNNDELWNNDGVEINIEVQPPFWLSIPAKLLYFVVICVIIYLAVHFYQKRNKIKQKYQLEAFKSEQEKISFQSKITFFTNIAHEVRTPLSLIKAPLEEIILSEGRELQPNLSIIEKNCNRLSDLINQLLDFRKMESTAYIVSPARIDMNALITEIHERFSKTASKKKIELRLVLPPADKVEAITDPEAVTKVISNLLTNALKFTNNKIILRLKNDNDKYTVEIEDNGIGVADNMKKLIFDPFFQVQQAKSHSGTGIGLALVKHLTELLHGSINVFDSPKGGAKFVFSFENLVLSTTQKEVIIEEESLKAEEEVSADKGKQISILIVDDNEEMLEFLTSSLEGEYRIKAATNAMEGLLQLNEVGYDLVITDIMMPEVDGISFVKRIREDQNYSHIPVVLLSAKTETSVKIEGLKSGADVFVEKPFSISYLKAQIKTLLQNRQAVMEKFKESPFAPYSGLSNNKKDIEFLNKLNEEIEKNIADVNFSIESLTSTLFISRSNLQRKLKAICNVTPGDYLRTYRLKKSCKLLIETDMRINEVAYAVGFNSSSYFTKSFFRQFNVLPKDFVAKYKDQDISEEEDGNI